MAVFEFLLRNWYLLFIVYGIITAIRAKRKAADGSQGAPKGGMPSFGGDSSLRPAAGRSGRQKAGNTASASSPDIIGAAKAEPSRSPAVSRTSARVAPVKPAASRASSAEPIDLFPEDGKVSQEIVRGLVWSEIIGPPRAKKPYNPRK